MQDPHSGEGGGEPLPLAAQALKLRRLPCTASELGCMPQWSGLAGLLHVCVLLAGGGLWCILGCLCGSGLHGQWG